MAEGQKYTFDVVVSRFQPDASKADKYNDLNEIKMVVQFNNKMLKISKSRINVDEFKPNTGLDFMASPKKIRKNLEECGIPVQFNYSNKLEGTGLITIPQPSIDAIQENMSDWIFTGTCNVELEGIIAGQVDLLCRLIVKCDEPKEDSPKACTNVADAVNRNDIMFVMTDSQRNANPCDPCLDILPPEEGDEMLQLDLERYRAFQEALKTTKVFKHSPAGNAACCEIKKMALECQEVVDSIIRESGVPVPLKPPCRHPPESTCTGPDLDYFPPIENPLTSPNAPCYSYLPARKEEPADFCSPNFIPVPISELAKPMIKPIRFCPVCLTDMSWLPKFANCPTCGVKPMPVVEDRHKDKARRADDIIDEHLGKQNRSIDYYCKDPCNPPPEDEENEDDKCYCTCKFGKLCAHCRIRNMVEDIFKVSKKECPIPKSEGSEDLCMAEDDESNCRPYLARVFSEMRDLYNIRDTKRPSESDTPTAAHHPKAKVRTKLKVWQGPMRTDGNERSMAEKLKFRQRVLIMEEKEKLKKKKPKPVSRVPKNNHRKCVRTVGPVGHRHGWAWHLAGEAVSEGWRPGWIRKSVKKLMKFFLNPDDSPYMFCKKKAEEDAEKQRNLPTLNLAKKDGVTYVTLRPLNDRNIQMHPIVFKITKSDKAEAASRIKAILKDRGFPKCTCHQTVMMCNCRNKQDKKRLEYAVQQESRRHCVENVVDLLVLTDTSESEMEYDLDFPTAAGAESAVWPPPRKPTSVNKGTQFDKKDLVVVPKYPTKLDPYWRAYDCAAGDRYTGTAFGAPGEEVFEDGIFGYGGGGPHGASGGGVHGAAGGGPMRGGGRAGAGRGSRGAGGAGGRGGPGGAGGAFGGKGFPGKKLAKGEKPPPAPPIPVRMTDKYYKQVDEAEKARKDKIKADLAHKKKGINLIEYLEEKGSVPKPWDPNNPKPKNLPPKPKGPPVGSDGLTDAQRRRRELLMGPMPPIDHMPRLGKCPGNCYDPCNGQVCCSCFYNYYC